MQVQLTQSLTALSPTSTSQSGGQSQPAQTGSVTQSGSVGNNSTDSKNGQQDAAALNDAVGKLNEAVKNYANGNSLQFSVDPDSQTHIVKVIDSQTKDVIRQIPSEQAIAIAKAIGQFEGLLIKDKA
ncbi:flagellar protein FlaG [Silvimonas terrae]|uniref:Flagellar protein FlaG n=1 Tax=Silvimonas terrae TaxID=300266 RepID=A0A840RC22_9NEIS|nr:flagellar protein FlaG [Silvimonas terrae]MBB5189943.1 flagellar protein FlaG [Silvimonas terrae]